MRMVTSVGVPVQITSDDCEYNDNSVSCLMLIQQISLIIGSAAVSFNCAVSIVFSTLPSS